MNRKEWKIGLLSLLQNDYDPEELMIALSEIIEYEKTEQTSDLVNSCLTTSIEGLRQAALDYYVSTK